MKNNKLVIEYIPIDDLTPYEGNAKIHTPEQIAKIKKSIDELGMNDPIGVYGKNNTIVEGHGRFMACKELGLKTVPVVRLDHMTEDQRKAYTIVHNQLTMDTGFDMQKLDMELEKIELDMSGYGLDMSNIDWDNVDEINDDNYDEPEHRMLECPKCHHIDRDIHFQKVN